MTKLSVNINKIATLRNARGGNEPNVLNAAISVQRFGADGITVHPRPDERHITYQDTIDISGIIHTEYNIEGNPKKGRFLELVKKLKPTQATLVPDSDDVLTSNAGWNTFENKAYLTQIVKEIKSYGVRTSIFMDPIPEWIELVKEIGADRIELYTEKYAKEFPVNPEMSISEYVKSAELAKKLGIEVNAGHDLSLENLNYFIQKIPFIAEVSIGHALISDALYYGLENTIQLYKRKLII